MEKIILKNMSGATLCLVYPNIKFRALLLPTRQIAVSEDVFDEMRYDAGTEELLLNGALKVMSEEQSASRSFEEALSSAEEGVANGKIVMSRDEVVKLLQSGTIAQFAKTIKDASPATLNTIADVAIELSVADGAHTELIKKYCGIDVIKALSLKPTV